MSCLNEKFFNQVNENHQVKIQPSTKRLSSANQMHIQIKGTVSVPIKIGPKKYEHTFYVLIEAASDCLLGLDFLETNKCDALFSEGRLKINRKILVPLYRKHFSFDEKQVFRVVALEKISIPPQHVMILEYDLENVQKAISKEVNNNCRSDFRNLIVDCSDIFSINQSDLGKCHRIEN